MVTIYLKIRKFIKLLKLLKLNYLNWKKSEIHIAIFAIATLNP
jgi:hypothetical protein